MKTIEIEIAIIKYLDYRQNLTVPNISWSFFNHECDLLSLSKSGYATEIEIKISKSDLKKDKEKWHNHYSQLIKNFYFAVPEELKEYAINNIPKEAGLLIVSKIENDINLKIYGNTDKFHYSVTKIKNCIPRKYAKKWVDKDRYKLARLGTMRIAGLKEKILKLSIT